MAYRILLVDDEPHNRYILRIFLDALNYDIVEAASGKQAIQLIAECSIDLILLDLMLPDMSGFDVCHTLLQMEDFKVPIIMMSADVQQETIMRGLQLGARDYLKKPYDLDMLQHKVKLALEGQNAE